MTTSIPFSAHRQPIYRKPFHRQLTAAICASVLLAFSIAACTDGGEVGSRSRAAEVVIRDSVGIRIVESQAAVWGGGEGWQIDSVPELIIGSSGVASAATSLAPRRVEIDLELVRAVRPLPGGQIAIADAGPAEVMVFDGAGELLHTFGGRGEGPEEFRGILDLHVCGGDTLAVVGQRQTLSFFDPEGRYIRAVGPLRPEGGLLLAVAGLSSDCGRALVQQRAGLPPLDMIGVTEDVFVWIDLEAQRADTIARVALLEAWTRSLDGAVRPFLIPWGTSSRTYATNNDRLVLGQGRIPELQTYDATGTLESIVRWSPAPEPVTAADRARYAERRAEFVARVPSDEPEAQLLFPALGEYADLPSHKPIFDRVLIDDDDRIWIRMFPAESFGLFDSRLQEPPRRTERWTVFDANGIWLGAIELPERLELHAVADDRIFGVGRDDLDVETVQVFRITSGS